MRKRMFTTGLAVMCGLVLTATGLWASAASEAEPTAAADREMVRDPSTGQMILKPQYGGSVAEAWASDRWKAHRHLVGGSASERRCELLSGEDGYRGLGIRQGYI